MKKWMGIIGCILLVILLVIVFVNSNGEKTREAAINKVLGSEELRDLQKQKFQLVNIPKSPYALCITDVPHSIYIIEVSKRFGNYKGELDGAFPLYTGDPKTTFIVNGTLKYGFDTERPEGKEINIDGKKMNVVHLSKYFENSKYKYNYRNLDFYYPNKPFKLIENNLMFSDIKYK